MNKNEWLLAVMRDRFGKRDKSAKKVATVLALEAQGDTYEAGNLHIAEVLGVEYDDSPNTTGTNLAHIEISRALKTLDDAGFITRTPRRKGQPFGTITLLDPNAENTPNRKEVS